MTRQPAIPDRIKTVAIVGAGTIGASWTALFLAAGLKVQVYDPSEHAEGYVRDYIKNAWPALRELGLASEACAGEPSFFSSPEAAVAGADFVQESVPERLPIKHDLFRRIEPELAKDTLVASSASGLMVKEMQEAWRDPARFFLAHPFNPPHLIPLVELLGNALTAPGVLDEAAQLYEACGKVTIRLNKEVPGHVANRLQAALWREAVNLVVDGVASVKDVDTAIASGPGLRWAVMGPHMLFSLGSGGHGMGTFIERFGPSIERWWQDLGTTRLTPEVGRILAEGVAEEEAGREFETLASERDRNVIRILKALKNG